MIGRDADPRHRPRRRSARRCARDCDVLICGASFAGLTRRARARGRGRARADARPLRDRRARDVGVRGADGVARAARPARVDPRRRSPTCVVHVPGARACAGRCRSRSRPSTTAGCASCCATARRRATFATATVDGDRAPVPSTACATDRGELRAPIVVDALGWRRVLSDRPARCSRPQARLSRGLEVHPDGSGDELELWIDPAYVRAGLQLELPRGGRDARRLRLVRAARPRQGADRRARGRARPRRRPLPGQLDPAPAARRDRGRRLLRRRLRRPLPAADRRGDPAGVLLRARARSRAARRCSPGARHARTCARALRRVQRRATVGTFASLLLAQHLVGRTVGQRRARAPRCGPSTGRRRSRAGSSVTTSAIAPPAVAGEHAAPRARARPRAPPCRRSA